MLQYLLHVLDARGHLIVDTLRIVLLAPVERLLGLLAQLVIELLLQVVALLLLLVASANTSRLTGSLAVYNIEHYASRA